MFLSFCSVIFFSNMWWKVAFLPFAVTCIVHQCLKCFTRFLKKEFLLGNSCPLWQAFLLGMQLHNSNLKPFFRIVHQYYWEDTISCQPNHIMIILYLWKIQVFYFILHFRTFLCVFQLLVVDVVYYFLLRYGFEDCLIIVASL